MPTHPSHHDLGDAPDGTTRTRLPEGDAGTARRPARSSSRTLVTVVGVVVLLIAALAFATRGGGNGDGTGSGGGSSASGPGAAANPTAPTGARPVDGKTAGIADGFPHSQEGAQSAAANYAVALGGEGMFRTESRHRIVSAVYDPAVLASVQNRLDAAYSADFLSNVGLQADGSAPSGFTFVSRIVPVGTKATAYTADSTTVEVWCTGLVGLAGVGSTKPVTENWFTVTEQLQWVDGDWKVESSSQKQGPAPISGDSQASTAEEIVNAVNGYGGFTYAR